MTQRTALSTIAICNSIRKEVSEQSPARHEALCYSLFLQKQAENISRLRIFQLIIFFPCLQCVYVRMIDDGPLSSFQGRSSFHASLLQAIDGVMSLALCPQIVSRAPQHFRSSKKQAACVSLCPPVYRLSSLETPSGGHG